MYSKIWYSFRPQTSTDGVCADDTSQTDDLVLSSSPFRQYEKKSLFKLKLKQDKTRDYFVDHLAIFANVACLYSCFKNLILAIIPY